METIKSSKFALMKQLLLLLLVICNNVLFAHVNKEKLTISKKRIDSILVSIPQKTVLKAEIISCSQKGQTPCKD